jgi:hypothetical protein
LIAAAVLAADIAISELLSLVEFYPVRVIGDLLLLETGILAVLGGLVEFSRSIGVYEFRRLLFHTREETSPTRHKDASKRALMLFSAALVLFLALVVLALWE